MSSLAIGEFYGDSTGRGAMAGVVLSRLDHRTARLLPAHTHEAAYFSLLLRGQYRETSGERTIEYKPLTLVFHPPGTRHVDELGPLGGVFLTIELAPFWLEGHERSLRYARPEVGDALWLALRLYSAHHSGSVTPLEVESSVSEMLATAVSFSTGDERGFPTWLGVVVERLTEEVATPFTLSALAGGAGVHPVHLARVFRRRFGITIGEFLKRQRVNAAAKLIAGNEHSLSAIAQLSGFSDQSHLTRAFQSVMGTSPGRMRTLIRA